MVVQPVPLSMGTTRLLVVRQTRDVLFASCHLFFFREEFTVVDLLIGTTLALPKLFSYKKKIWASFLPTK